MDDKENMLNLKDTNEEFERPDGDNEHEHQSEDRDRTKRLKEEILNYLNEKDYRKLRDETSDLHPADLAAVLEDLDENNRLVVFRLLRKDTATDAFTFMSDDARAELVEGFSDAEIVNTIEEIGLDDAADMLEDMPASVVKRVLAKSSAKTRESLNKLLHYPEYSAGSIMTPEYIRFRKEMDVKEALNEIRKQGPEAETVYSGYVVEHNRLLGVVSTRDLLLSEPEVPLEEIMDDHVVTVKVTDDQEFVARQLAKYDFTAMPVVDEEGMLVGIVTIDDAVDVLTDESTEDMQKMAAILPDDQAASYFGTSVWKHAKQRIPWLLILMLSATLTGMVTTRYETAFNALPLLVAFMPMLNRSGLPSRDLEGIQGCRNCRIHSRCRKRAPDSDHVSGDSVIDRENSGSQQLPLCACCQYRAFRGDRAQQICRLGTSSFSPADRRGPGDYGDTVYYDHCRRMLTDYLFPYRGDRFCVSDRCSFDGVVSC